MVSNIMLDTALRLAGLKALFEWDHYTVCNYKAGKYDLALDLRNEVLEELQVCIDSLTSEVLRRGGVMARKESEHPTHKVLLGCIERYEDMQIRVSAYEYQGQNWVDIRVWVLNEATGDYFSTYKGVVLREDEAPTVMQWLKGISDRYVLDLLAKKPEPVGVEIPGIGRPEPKKPRKGAHKVKKDFLPCDPDQEEVILL